MLKVVWKYTSNATHSMKLTNGFIPNYTQSLRTTFLVHPKRNYAQSWDDRQPNDKIDAHIKVQKLMDEINSKPSVLEKLEHVSNVMIEKNLIDLDAATNEGNTMKPWQMIKILMDRDLRHAMKEFKSELEKSGIQLGPDQLGPLMTVLGLEKKK
ncbi:YGL041W-A-like protein [Saccharomyces cerevisiae x Saccharomyces kudriavzevii VIN7]|uniref:YGL041W-A-like protein n=1 Tax=Saccharomyces cerevisiae x Saccharomyces kudriavzevii (strain VIN7) TaxID=1095631 RepID=H0GUU9_SACCK|nr:YGL041W-A-like protein [Saccharomyces cerevisiae x Saccharomyces kudriavzevii VIN7]